MRCVGLILLQRGQSVDEEIQFTADPQALGTRGFHKGGDGRVLRGQSRALQHPLHPGQRPRRALQGISLQRAAQPLGRGHVLRQGLRLGRLLARIPHRHGGPPARAPARHRQPGLTEAENEHVETGELLHVSSQRSFKLARPMRHSSMVMIQKRTTTCVSVQPFFSKWWCSGAIRKMRRPSP